MNKILVSSLSFLLRLRDVEDTCDEIVTIELKVSMGGTLTVNGINPMPAETLYGSDVVCRLPAATFDRLVTFLKMLPEQPITVELYENKIEITHCVAVFQ